MAEHFTFEQTLGDSSQVHFDKRLFGTLAVDVYRLGYQFLARPTFSGDQYGSIRLCYTGNGVQYFRQSLTTADDMTTVVGDTYNSVLSVLQLGLLVTSFLLLFVSVLGQINIGLSSLEQRTHELLIRRAIGASRANIVTLVLGAQLTISVFVCIVSILISFFLVQGMGLFLTVDSPVAALEYPILSAVVAVITSVVVALLGGLLPALKAAKLEPALALR